MKKLAIIGASYLQLPLIRRAKEMGIETHVFAWKCGDVGESEADCFYPISIVEKDEILSICRKIGVDGICSIASDLAVLTVCYVAEQMGLVSNGIESSLMSVNKYAMKKSFEQNRVPVARCKLASIDIIPDVSDMKYPLIIKPTDRSGSRGVTRIDSADDDIKAAIDRALEQSLEKRALVEEYVFGDEYSVECISFEGRHTLLSVTKKYTTGAPHYIEVGHLEPANISDDIYEEIERIVFRGLDALKIRYGASHSELKINGKEIKIIEIGARMGGDMIGSTLVRLSTGYDFVKAVIDISLGCEPEMFHQSVGRTAAIRYFMDDVSEASYQRIKTECPELLFDVNEDRADSSIVADSSGRKGYFIVFSKDRQKLEEYMPSD